MTSFSGLAYSAYAYLASPSFKEDNEENWGMRKLAYPIEKKSTGFYEFIEFNAEPSVVAKLEVNFRRDERVIRFLTIKQDKYAAEYAAKRRSLRQSKSEEA